MNETRNQQLFSQMSNLQGQMKRNHGLRAALRRAASPDDVLGIEAVERFALAINPDDDGSEGAALAILLAQTNVETEPVTARRNESLAARLGKKNSDRRLLSDLRFARLIHAKDAGTRLRLLRRALGVLDAQVPAAVLAKGWQQLQTPMGRRQFARAYFTADGDAGDPIANAPTSAKEIQQ